MTKAAGVEIGPIATQGREEPRGASIGDGVPGSDIGDEVTPRQRVIEAAIEGLTALDPAALSIQRICDRAQVTPPTLYHHFGSKDGLTATAVDVLVTRWLDELDAAVDRRASLDQALEQAVDAWHAMITSPQRPFAVFIWVSMWSEESRAALVRAREHAHKLIRDSIAAHSGSAPAGDELAALVLDGVLGAAVDYQLDSDSQALRRRLTALTGVVRLIVATSQTPRESTRTGPAGA